MWSGPTTHHPLTYYLGDTVLLDVTCVDGQGLPLSLAGATIEWMLNGPDGANVITYSGVGTILEGIIVTNSPAGEIQITLPKEKTETFAAGMYQDQLRVTNADGFRSTQMVGLIEFKTPLNKLNILPGAASLAVSSPEIETPSLT